MNTEKALETIQKWIVESGKSQAQLAEESGVSTSTISLILSGRRKPSAGVLGDLAEALDHDKEEIYKIAGLISSDNNDPWVIATQRQLAQLTPESRDIADTLIKALRDREKGQHKK